VGDETRDGVRLTNLDQELFDGAGVGKRELVDYLDAVADRLVPVLADRPLSVVRARLGQPAFMQKNVPAFAPEWIRTVAIPARTSHRDVRYALCDDRRTLLWFANQRAVEYHPQLFRLAGAGWDHPTHLVLDLDPPEGDGFAAAAAAAHLVRRVLEEAGMSGAVKTSGAKGVHVFVPLDEAAPAAVEDVAAATRAIAARAERLDPELATTAFIRDDRGGKVFLDSTRAGGATVVAAYSPRARPGLPVSFPLSWDELDGVSPRELTVRTALQRLGDGDPWRELMPEPQRLDAGLVAEGHTIPVARVQAMHEGKRRKRAAERPAP
jgi:bifunctional non-homologous end joining protein LigD